MPVYGCFFFEYFNYISATFLQGGALGIFLQA
jgi:hypothetical protein